MQVEVFLGRSRHKDQPESGITGLNSAMMDKLQACELKQPSSSLPHTQNCEVRAEDKEERGR